MEKSPNGAKKSSGKVLATRGFMMGAVIDDHGEISKQIKTFCAIQQYDHNRLLETIFRDLLGLVNKL